MTTARYIAVVKVAMLQGLVRKVAILRLGTTESPVNLWNLRD